MRIIENDWLRAEIDDYGAQLCAVYDKTNGRNVLWTADPAYWNRHSPILFPFVGKVGNLVYRYNGKEYTMGQHGFARDMVFTCVEETPVSVTHRLTSTPETKVNYPFDFALTITQTLVKNTVKVDWKVENTGKGPLYFSIGGHPGFMCPVLPGTKQTDYTLSFPGCETLICKTVDVDLGTVADDRDIIMHIADEKLPITAHTFDGDALIFDNNQVREVRLLYPDGRPYITMHCPAFPSLAVWSKPANAAPFVCFEPWTGRCDNTGFTGELPEKFGIEKLDEGAVFTRGYDFCVE